MKRDLEMGAAVRAAMGIQFFADDGGADMGGAADTVETGAAAADAPGDGGLESVFDAADFGDGSLFDDMPAEGAPESGEADAATPDGENLPDDAQATGGAVEQTFEVNLGGETVQLTAAQMAERLAAAQPPAPDQLDQLVQQQLAQHPAMQLIERKARNSGLTVDQYLQAMAEQEQAREVQALMQQTGLSKELAAELYESRKFREQAAAREREEAERKAAEEQQSKVFGTFLSEFPDVKAEDIKPEVWQRVESGMDLTAAYALSRVRELETQLATMKNNAHVRGKAIGSATGVEQTGGRDPVLDGLNGVMY